MSQVTGHQMDLKTTLAAFLEAATNPRSGDPRLNELGPKLLSLADGEPKEVLDEVLSELVGALNVPHPQVAGFVGLLCGCFVEKGADPDLLAILMLPATERALAESVRAWTAVSKLPEVAANDASTRAVVIGPCRVSARQWQDVVDADPVSAQCLLALDKFCQPLIAALTRVPGLLKTEVVQRLIPLLTSASETSVYAGFLARLLRVPIDEEWLLIDPKDSRGFALRVSGVANAFQVYALIHAAMAGMPATLGQRPRSLPGHPPPEEVSAVARGDGPQQLPGVYAPPFTLFRWSSVTAKRSVPNNEDYMEWYSNSAVPAELARFNGPRIAVVGEFGFAMQLGTAREFEALKADVSVVREIATVEVGELLEAFKTAAHPGRPEPGVGWP